MTPQNPGALTTPTPTPAASWSLPPYLPSPVQGLLSLTRPTWELASHPLGCVHWEQAEDEVGPNLDAVEAAVKKQIKSHTLEGLQWGGWQEPADALASRGGG